MTPEEKKILAPHTLTLSNRKKMVVTGVEEVGRFDEEEVALFTSDGGLSIHGQSLHIQKVSLETGEVLLEGEVTSLQYSDVKPKAKGLLAKVFR